MKLDKAYFLPKNYLGPTRRRAGNHKNAPRKWTQPEINWLIMLRAFNFSKPEIAILLYRNYTSVSLKIKRLDKADGYSYNKEHRADKYFYNNVFFEYINPQTVLDLFAGPVSFYSKKPTKLTTNDINKNYNHSFNLPAEKLLYKLNFENKTFDLIDLDPYGSAFNSFDLAVKIAKKGIVITLGELGHKRFKRLDFVSRVYGIKNLEKFTVNEIILELEKTALRHKKIIKPCFIREYRNLARVYFEIIKP